MISHKIILLVNLFVLFCASSSKISPDYIQPCPGLKSDCLKRNFQETLPHFAKGIPSLGVAPLDPLVMSDDKINFDLAGGLKIKMTNGTVTGLRKCIIEDITYENMSSDMTVRCNFTLRSKYKANGKILIVSLNGDGDAKIRTPNVLLKAKLYFEDKTRDGVVYREIKNYKMSYEYLDPATFLLTNLFKGSPELSQTILAFLNANWKQVIDEFGKPLIDTTIHITFDIIKKFLSVVPRDELFV